MREMLELEEVHNYITNILKKDRGYSSQGPFVQRYPTYIDEVQILSEKQAIVFVSSLNGNTVFFLSKEKTGEIWHKREYTGKWKAKNISINYGIAEFFINDEQRSVSLKREDNN